MFSRLGVGHGIMGRRLEELEQTAGDGMQGGHPAKADGMSRLK